MRSAVLACFCFAAALLSAQPSAQPSPTNLVSDSAVELPDAPPVPLKKCGPWSCWDYTKHHRPLEEVVRSRPFWLTVGGDFLISSSDAEISHEGYAHHKCWEGADGLPHYASRSQLYRYQLPENAAVAFASAIWLMAKMPKPALPMYLVWPAIVHGRADADWFQHCW